MDESIVKIPSVNISVFEPFVPQVAKTVKLISYVGVITEDKIETAQKIISEGKSLIKTIEESLDKCNRPYINLKNEINAEQSKAKERCAEVTKPLSEAIKKISDSIIAFNREMQEKKKKEAAELQKKLQVQSGGVYNPGNNEKPVSVAIPEPPKIKGLKKILKYKIVDAVKVPRGYCSPDDDLIKAAFKAGVREIPGLEIWEEEIIQG